MAVSKLMLAVVVMAIASFQLPSAEAQTRHIVGDNVGWTIPMNGNVNYTTWAASQSFSVGDVLVFNFTTGNHDVAEVTEVAYGPCNINTPLSQENNGPATITLNTTGNHYYICTIGRHCSLGQKLAITVGGNSSAPPPAGGMTPPPAGGMTPPSPPAPSSASSLSGVVPVAFLAAALAIFY